MRRALLAALLAAGAAAPVAPVRAYETPTHARMSVEAARASVLPSRLPDVGSTSNTRLFALDSLLRDGGLYLFGFTLFERQAEVSGWMAYGAVQEDSLVCCPPLRVQNHFYNPRAPAGQEGFKGTGTPSLQWGLEPAEISGQEYSYRDAREYFHQGLVAPSARERRKNLAKMFRSIGQVIHLVQDIGQPQHTRDDSHASGSFYEAYTDQQRGRLDYGGYGPVQITAPGDLWVTPDGKGLAQFSNANFVTAGTNLTGTRSGNALNVRPNPRFPSPGDADVQVEKLQITDLLGPPGPDQPLIGEIWFVSTPVLDRNTGLLTRNPRTSTYSIFDEDLSRAGFEWTFTLNRFNFDAAHGFLIPRAVGYSASLINHFFRGRIAITAPDEAIYAMIDPTQKDGFARLKVKLQNTTPNETLTGDLWLVVKFYRNNCYRNDLTGEANGPNAPDIVACRSDTEEMLTSGPKQVSLASGAAPLLQPFDFTTPIPVNAMDLFVQAVFRGQVGTEAGAVAVGTLDLFEPTHIAFYNATDVAEINDTFHLFTRIVAGIAAGDPTFAPVDRNGDKTYNPGSGDFNITPFDLSNVAISFTGFNRNVVATIPSLPKGRFSRMAVVTDRNPVQFFAGSGNAFNTLPAFNQLSEDGRTLFVTSVAKLRKAHVTDALVLVYCVFTTSCQGNLLTVPDSESPDALTPMPVTVNIP